MITNRHVNLKTLKCINSDVDAYFYTWLKQNVRYNEDCKLQKFNIVIFTLQMPTLEQRNFITGWRNANKLLVVFVRSCQFCEEVVYTVYNSLCRTSCGGGLGEHRMWARLDRDLMTLSLEYEGAQ